MVNNDSDSFGGWPPIPVETVIKEATEEEDWKKKYLYLMAEFDNFRKRNKKELEESFLNGSVKVIKSLLPVLESIEAAFNDLNKVLTDDRKKGLSMIITALNKTLNEIGLEVVNPINSQFDPLSSEVLMEKEDDKNPDNVVLEVIRKGYKINGVLIKPAQVIVSKHKN
ncbi:MAG: nucleotide exchange factor GrpE [Candidatus Thermoplasmatota archaeon]|jgi:molecular chaperone GrpE|nr:nucleotide exchange factor GrpE [Candidatus Thermoplasmatota archaeon]MCL5963142.1 nucleotide exchange factor GrpE [Candidatus Thermoplasmatota archaeon]